MKYEGGQKQEDGLKSADGTKYMWEAEVAEFGTPGRGSMSLQFEIAK